MRALEIIPGHVIYKPAYTYKFQLKTTIVDDLSLHSCADIKVENAELQGE